MATPSTQDERARQAIASRLADAGFALPGTMLERRAVCGKANCRCTGDPPVPHGPFFQWTRKIGGKTITRRLSEDQVARYGPWFDNAKILRAALRELEELSLRVAEEGEHWS